MKAPKPTPNPTQVPTVTATPLRLVSSHRGIFLPLLVQREARPCLCIEVRLKQYPAWKTVKQNHDLFDQLHRDVEFLTLDMYFQLLTQGYCLVAFPTWAELLLHLGRVHGKASEGKNLSPYCLARAVCYSARGELLGNNDS